MAGYYGAREVFACAAPSLSGARLGQDYSASHHASAYFFRDCPSKRAENGVYHLLQSAFRKLRERGGAGVVTAQGGICTPLLMHPPIFLLCSCAQTSNNGDVKGQAVLECAQRAGRPRHVWMRAQPLVRIGFFVSMPTGLPSREPAKVAR